MSNASRPVFATSKTEEFPSRFKPLFDEGKYQWRDEYELPADANEVKYFYLGYTSVDKYDTPQKLIVYQYKRENSSQVKIGFNETAVKPLMNMTAILENNTLKVDGKTFGTKDLLPPNVIKEIRQIYITPILKPEKSSNTIPTQGKKTTKARQIFPTKEMDLKLSAISGTPFEFVPEDPLAFKYNDWYYLKNEYNDVLENNSSLLDFLQLSSGLIQHQNVQKQNADDLIGYYINVTNKYNDKPTNQFQIIEFYIDKIEPAINSFRSGEVFNKNYEIFASNSLAIALINNNETLKLKIYNMLGNDFDIKKLQHGTLLYNLACDYSRNKEKKKMLEAIELAIKKGKKPENFAKDTDFQFYFTDPDFLKVISVKEK